MLFRVARHTCSQSTTSIARRSVSSWREGFEKLSHENLGPQDKKDILRRAHAAETFRSAFAKAAGGHSVSTLDLEELMIQNRVRPSALLGLYTLGACALGLVERGMKIAGTSDCVASVVEDAVQQQFNDSIRHMQGMEADEDTKEALKFHRDVVSSSSNATEHAHEQSESNPIAGSMKAAKESAGQVLYHALRTSSKF